MTGTGAVVRGGLGRRWVHTTAIAVTAFLSVAASALGIGLIVASTAPFERAFAAQYGAHLQVDFAPPASATTDALSATAAAAGVTATAGPYATATVQARIAAAALGFEPADTASAPAELDLGTLTIAGRADPDDAVDRIAISEGRWAAAAGEIVLDTESAPDGSVGTQVVLTTPAGEVAATVVGLAHSVTGTADGWTTPTTVDALAQNGATREYQMLYRFSAAATAEEMVANLAAVTAAAPAGSVSGAQSYLTVQQEVTANAAVFVPFVVAFGALAMVMSMLIVAIVVSGTVGAARRRIGVLKSIGCTPGQVVRSFQAQALVPAAAGIALGAVAADLLARPVLSEVGETYGAGQVAIPRWLTALVSVGLLMLVAVAAAVPALRVGNRSTVQAWSPVHPPRRGPVATVGRALSALRLPRPVTLGLGAPLRRPVGSAATAAAVIVGVLSLTFSVGLLISVTRVQHGRDPLAGGQITVQAGAGAGAPAGAVRTGPSGTGGMLSDPKAVAAAIAATPGSAHWFGIASAQLQVSGLVGATTVSALTGDTSWTDHQLISGQWLTGAAGEAVMSARAMQAAGVSVGDRLTLTAGTRTTDVTVVGEVFDLTHDGLVVYTDASALSAVGLSGDPAEYVVGLSPDTDVQAYLASLDLALEPVGAASRPVPDGQSSVLVTMNLLIATLATMLLAVAGVGVLTAVLLDTRERARDLGVLKALGMTPRQIVGTVCTSVLAIGLVAGVVSVPLGVALHHAVVPMLGETAGTPLPTSAVAVFSAPVVALMLSAGAVLGLLGAILPAGWAAGGSTSTALRAE